jgi:hypothetical protein
MRRNLTWALVGAIGLIAAIAAADALRGHEPEARPAPGGTTTERPPSLVETLRDQLVFGHVLYSDQDCRLHSLILPQMIDQVARLAPQCRFGSTEGWILKEDERLSPDWAFTARCSDGEIVVRELESGIVRRRIAGCTPAWRPPAGHRLAWARGETIYERGQPLLARRDLHELARRHPNVAQLSAPFRVVVTDLAWVDPEHLVVSLEIRSRHVPREYLAVMLEGKTVVAQATTFQGPLGHWFASPAGSFVAAADGTMLTAAGETVPRQDGLPAGRAVAFSPDERWLAYVTGRSVYLIGTPRNNEPGRIIRIPIPARDLSWERITTTTRVAGQGTG